MVGRPQQNRIRIVAKGSPTPKASTPTSTSNSGNGCGLFFTGGMLQAPPQPARSALGKDTGIPEGKNPGCPRKDRKGGKNSRNRRGLSYGR
ncbi:hypothetical protein E2C01_033465 [Portunus trituberculatus]|uniref:Uncharacterized protein n=1 Tax=Portunus trituberculatus TaxID=210409 RepID=A0A5B7F495_PORTR|nr:hypothetical protein [Portunus trituberculatus]